MHGLDLQFERMEMWRVVATSGALDTLISEWDGITLRLAPDEMLLVPGGSRPLLKHDLHAVLQEESAYFGVWLPESKALNLLASHCEWEPPEQRPTFAQGAVAGVATKIWFEGERVLILVAAPYVYELRERLT